MLRFTDGETTCEVPQTEQTREVDAQCLVFIQYHRRSWLHAPGRGHDIARQEEQLSTRPKQSIDGAFPRAEPAPCSRQPTGHTIESIRRCSSSGTAPACDEGARVSQTKSRHRRRLHQMHLRWCFRGRHANPRASSKHPASSIRSMEFCTFSAPPVASRRHVRSL